MEARNEILNILTTLMKVDRGNITEATTRKELGVDSLDEVEILIDIEEAFEIEIEDDAFKYIEAIIYSMTAQERANPELINMARKNRIAKGSGTNIQEVNKLMKQFEDTKKMMKMMSNPAKMAQMMKQMKGMGGMPGA